MKKGMLTCGVFGLLGFAMLAAPANEAKADGLIELVDQIVTEPLDTVTEATNLPRSDGKVSGLLNGVDRTVEGVLDVTGKTVEGVLDVTGQTVDDVRDTTGQTVEGLTETVDRTLEGTVDSVDELLDNLPLPEVTQPLLDPVDPLLDTLQEVTDRKPVSGIVVPIVDWTTDRATEATERTLDQVKDTPPIKRDRPITRDEAEAPRANDSKAPILSETKPQTNAVATSDANAAPDSATSNKVERQPKKVLSDPQPLLPIASKTPAAPEYERTADNATRDAERSATISSVKADSFQPAVLPLTKALQEEARKPGRKSERKPEERSIVRTLNGSSPFQPLSRPASRDLASIVPVLAPTSANGSIGGGQQNGGTDGNGSVGRWLSILIDDRASVDRHSAPNWLKLLFLKDQYAQAPPLMPPRASFFAAVAY